VWGGPRRIYSAFKFFLYTFLGSVLMLVAVLAIYFNAGTTDIVESRDTSPSTPAGGHAELAVVCLPGLLRRERCRCGRCIPGYPTPTWRRHGRLGDFGRRAPEDRRLRLPALLPADAADRLGPVHGR